MCVYTCIYNHNITNIEYILVSWSLYCVYLIKNLLKDMFTVNNSLVFYYLKTERYANSGPVYTHTEYMQTVCLNHRSLAVNHSVQPSTLSIFM